ncbi:MAG: hypothetical protein U0903_18760 [Planctomycetales bacterium]
MRNFFPSSDFALSRRQVLALLGISAMGWHGCASQEDDLVSIKQLSDAISVKELEWFCQIVDWLPSKKIPFFPSPLVPPEAWQHQDEKSIERLTQERVEELAKRWSVNQISSYLSRSRALRWALTRMESQVIVFAGLTVSLGAALCKASLPPEQKLLDLEKEARQHVDLLLEEKNSMKNIAKFSQDNGYRIAHDALWIPLWDLMLHLNQVPNDNLQLVIKNRARLEPMFPDEFHENLLNRYSRVLKDTGLPFEDLPGQKIDDLDVWNPESPTYQERTAPKSLGGISPEDADQSLSELLKQTSKDLENAMKSDDKARR